MDIEIISEQHYYLQKVSRYLNYQLSTSILYFLSYAGGITLILALFAATIFTPYLLYIFYKSRKISWIVSFFIVVLVPIIICIIIGQKLGHSAAFVLIPLGLFLFLLFYNETDSQ